MFIPGVSGDPSESEKPMGEAAAPSRSASVPPPPPIDGPVVVDDPGDGAGRLPTPDPMVGPVGTAAFSAPPVVPGASGPLGGATASFEFVAIPARGGMRIGGAGFTTLLTLLAVIVGGVLVWSEGTSGRASAVGGEESADTLGPVFEETLQQGFARAQREDKPVLLFFTADWCGPCRQLKGGALSDPMVHDLLARHFVAIKVDLTDRNGPDAAIAQAENVRGIPDMRVYAPDGREVARDIVAWSPDELAGNLARARRKAS